MWGNYGRILSEYIYIKEFRKNNLNQFIEIEGLEYLNEIKKNNKQVIFVSGHDHNLQYIVEDNTPQIVSGSGSKTTATKLTKSGLYSDAKQGYAKAQFTLFLMYDQELL